MDTRLITTSYYYDGKIESFTRAYLPTEEGSAVDQARAWVQSVGIQYDAGTEVHYTEEEITPETLRASYLDRSELIVVCGRVCALDAASQGAPAIPEGQTYREWSDQKDAFSGDYDFLREVAGEVDEHDNRLFAEAYLKNLFEESPCGPKEASTIRKNIIAVEVEEE